MKLSTILLTAGLTLASTGISSRAMAQMLPDTYSVPCATEVCETNGAYAENLSPDGNDIPDAIPADPEKYKIRRNRKSGYEVWVSEEVARELGKVYSENVRALGGVELPFCLMGRHYGKKYFVDSLAEPKRIKTGEYESTVDVLPCMLLEDTEYLGIVHNHPGSDGCDLNGRDRKRSEKKKNDYLEVIVCNIGGRKRNPALLRMAIYRIKAEDSGNKIEKAGSFFLPRNPKP